MSGPMVIARKVRWEWWHVAALLLLAVQLSLFTLVQMRPGIPGLVGWYLGADVILWWGVALLLAIAGLVTAIFRRPVFTRWRTLGAGLILLVAAAPFAYQSYPSSYDDKPSEVRFRLPMDGPITVAWGGATADMNYHVVAPDQRWAYDLLVTKEGKTHDGDGQRLEEYYCYGLPVVAPADGAVRATYIDARDMPPGLLGGMPAGGNQIVIEVTPKQFLFLCHLQPGSITVQPGEHVTQGQVLGRIGNSGNTSEPHLHIQLQDTPEDSFGEGIPLYFHNYRVGGRMVDRGIPTGGFKHGKLIGQIVEHAATHENAITSRQGRQGPRGR